MLRVLSGVAGQQHAEGMALEWSPVTYLLVTLNKLFLSFGVIWAE